MTQPYRSTKIFSGYSTCFRQWRAKESHCQYMHGYSLKFKVIFIGDLDERNWVMDFGCFSKNGVKEKLSDFFDHTTIVSKDDPHFEHFHKLEDLGLIQLRVVDHVGCEKFAEFVYKLIQDTLSRDGLSQRVRVHSVECIENEKNSAIYGEI